MDLFDKDGFCRPTTDIKQTGVRQPVRLVWEMTGDLEVKVDRALTFSRRVSRNKALVGLLSLSIKSVGCRI